MMTGKHPSVLISSAYLAIFAMLLLAIWNPTVPLGPATVDMLLLLDESNSMNARYNDSVWQSFVQQSNTLPAGSRISLIRFADRAKVEIPWISIQDSDFTRLDKNTPPRHRFLDKGSTDIDSALKAAINHSTPERRTAIILSSDGIDSVTPEQSAIMRSNNNPNLFIFFLQSTDKSHLANLHIESINLPATMIPGQSLPFSIAIKSIIGGQGSLELWHNERLVNSQKLTVQPGELTVLNQRLNTEQPGIQNLEFVVKNSTGNVIDRQQRLLDSRHGKQLLYIGHNTLRSESHQLQQNGWQITHRPPQQLISDETFFNRFDMIVMDDLAADSVDARVHDNLIRAVEQNATGLIVLGGPQSFGNGGYRHSDLETILPVLSESSRPLPSTAYVFVLDKSGSMEAANRADSRLSDALRAVTESAKSLHSGDESALLVFDRDVEVLLPLKTRADFASALKQTWQLQASGGTRIFPAFSQAINMLADSQSKQRFIIMVTDGFVDTDDVEPLTSALTNHNIQIIALAIGNNADLVKLHKLAAINGGQVLRIDHSAELPRLMRQTLETRQKSWHDAPITPITVQHAPFFSAKSNHWLNLPGYQVTRAKSSAQVYVATDKGEPLLAVHNYGAGRVAALPGGLLYSASGEYQLGALVTWMDSHQHNPSLKVSHQYVSGQLTITVDAVNSDSQWQALTDANIILTTPEGSSHSQALEAIAPGRFTAATAAPTVGLYRATIAVGKQQTRYQVYLAGNNESRLQTMVPWLQNSLAGKMIKNWDKHSLKELLVASSGSYASRPLWLLLALMSYLTVIVIERWAAVKTIANRLKPDNFRNTLHE